MSHIAKRCLTAALAALLCLSVLCACGQARTESSQWGNAAPFNMDTNHVGGVLLGAWVNPDNAVDRIPFADDLSFTRQDGGAKSEGKATLNEANGMLTLTYSDNTENSYVWVDSKSQINVNTWYVDGGTFAFGGTVYIKDNASQ